MKVTILSGKNEDEAGMEDMTIDGKRVLSVYPLYECPEDATIERDLVSCYTVLGLMKRAYEAGKRGEELVVEEKDMEE